MLGAGAASVFSKCAALRPTVGTHDARRDQRLGRRPVGSVARYALGGIPYVRVKLVVKEPTLCSPTAKEMSVTDRSVIRSNAAARSRRRVSR